MYWDENIPQIRGIPVKFNEIILQISVVTIYSKIPLSNNNFTNIVKNLYWDVQSLGQETFAGSCSEFYYCNYCRGLDEL